MGAMGLLNKSVQSPLLKGFFVFCLRSKDKENTLAFDGKGVRQYSQIKRKYVQYLELCPFPRVGGAKPYHKITAKKAMCYQFNVLIDAVPALHQCTGL
jgi:hypothetical protein